MKFPFKNYTIQKKALKEYKKIYRAIKLYSDIWTHKIFILLSFSILTEEKCTNKNKAVENLLLKQNHTVRRRMRNNVDKRYTLLSIYFNFLYRLLVLVRVEFLLWIFWSYLLNCTFNFNFISTLIQFSIFINLHIVHVLSHRNFIFVYEVPSSRWEEKQKKKKIMKYRHSHSGNRHETIVKDLFHFETISSWANVRAMFYMLVELVCFVINVRAIYILIFIATDNVYWLGMEINTNVKITSMRISKG